MTKKIIVNRLFKDKEIFKIEPLQMQRKWMNDTRQKFAYKCLPLNIASQYGWTVLSPVNFTVSWFGGINGADVDVVSSDPDFVTNSVVSHFGEATITLQLDFVIQTPENYSLYIRGIPNKDYGILKPLDAIVETDWLPFTFTYNFRFVESGIVEFKKGEPLFVFFPIERNTVENFELEYDFIGNKEEFNKDYNDYANSRHTFQYHNGDRLLFQRFYLNGRGPFKEYSIKNHIKRLLFGSKNNSNDI